MKSAGKARSNGLYRHIRTSKEIIRNLLNDSNNNSEHFDNISVHRNVHTPQLPSRDCTCNSSI